MPEGLTMKSLPLFWKVTEPDSLVVCFSTGDNS